MIINNLKTGGGNLETSESIEKKPRVDYIDLMKGLTILWIIWIHTVHPDFGTYRNPIFFFASGIFFKLTDAKTFFSKRLWNLIVPFIFFYFVSYPIRMIIHYIFFDRTMESFHWDCILDVFKIEPNLLLELNVPLWFLLALFWIHSFSFLLFKIPKLFILTMACFSLGFHNFFSQNFAAPFYINFALGCWGYFALGFLFGKSIISFLKNKSKKILLFSFSLLFLITFIYIEQQGFLRGYDIIVILKNIAFIFCYMAFFSFLNGYSFFNFLRFFGKNSLIVLGTHTWILPVLDFLTFTRFNAPHSPLFGLIISIITAIILIPIINLMNKHIPILIGKGRENGISFLKKRILSEQL